MHNSYFLSGQLLNNSGLKLFAKGFSMALLLLFAAPSDLLAQQNISYQIVDQGEVDDITPYIKSLDDANLDTYRRYDQRRILVFETGVRVELFAAKELTLYGVVVDLEKIDRSVGDPVRQSTFQLHPSGHLLERVDQPNRW